MMLCVCVIAPICASVCVCVCIYLQTCMCGYVLLCVFVLEGYQAEVQLSICVCVRLPKKFVQSHIVRAHTDHNLTAMGTLGISPLKCCYV